MEHKSHQFCCLSKSVIECEIDSLLLLVATEEKLNKLQLWLSPSVKPQGAVMSPLWLRAPQQSEQWETYLNKLPKGDIVAVFEEFAKKKDEFED